MVKYKISVSRWVDFLKEQEINNISFIEPAVLNSLTEKHGVIGWGPLFFDEGMNLNLIEVSFLDGKSAFNWKMIYE